MRQFPFRFVLPLVLLLLSGNWLLAQNPDISGDWKGAIELPSMNLEVLVTYSQKDGAWSGTMDIPLQQARDLKLTDMVVEGDQVRWNLADVPGSPSFAGKVDAEGTKIAGDFTQGGKSFPLVMVKASAEEAAAAQLSRQEALDKLVMLADSARKRAHVAGMSIAIVLDGEVILSRGFGYRDLEQQLPVDAQTVFAIGSSSKAFTTMGMGILADRGMLDWEKPVREYLPDFAMQDRFATEEMTAMDLVTHRSGLPRHDFAWYGSPASREELYHRLPYLEPNKSFRSTWQYQNFMYMTAGYLAGKLYGDSWEALTEKEILEPLGMTRSTTRLAGLQQDANAALGYRWDGKEKKTVRIPLRNIDAIGPAGSINSCADDMSHWLQLHLDKGEYQGKRLISQQELQQMHAPQMPMGVPSGGPEVGEPSYGKGWMIYPYKGIKLVEHGGNIDGFSAQVSLFPDKGLGIVVLTNQNGTRVGQTVTFYAADLLLGLEETDWMTRTMGPAGGGADREAPAKPKAIKGTKPGHQLADYAGRYSHPGYGIMEIKADDKGKALTMHYNSMEVPLSHYHYETFSGRIEQAEQDFLCTFFTGPSGDVERIYVPFEVTMDDIEFRKLPPARLSDPVFLDKLCGKYDLDRFRAEIAKVGDHDLQITVTGQGTLPLEPWRNTEFKVSGLNGYSVEFLLNESDEVTEIRLHQPGATTSGKPVVEDGE